MTGRPRRVLFGAATLAVAVLSFPDTALAQIQQSDVDSEPATTQTTQLVTSSTEVRRAVIGLLFVAVVGLIVLVLYWMLTGRAARQRFESEFGGRHVAEPVKRRRDRRGGRTEPAVASAPVARRAAGGPVATQAAAARVAAPAPAPPAPRRAKPQRPEPVVRPGEVHPGWLDPSGARTTPGTVHPAWADHATPRPAGAALPVERRAAAIEADRGVAQPVWNDSADGSWPRPFEGR